MPAPGGGGWDRWTDAKPLPADGLRARSAKGDIGATWWSQRFISALRDLQVGGRMDRGKRYARVGQVLDLDIGAGAIRATVQGSRPEPYDVQVRVPSLTAREWTKVEKALVAKASYLAKLLAGEMPADVDEAFASCEVALFPRTAAELVADCSCPDWASPCKHAAAALLLAAERFDDDPFLIFAFRGMPKERLLARLRARRDAAGPTPAAPAAAVADEGGEGVDPAGPALEPAHFWECGRQLDDVRPRPRPAVEPDAVLRELDPLDVAVRGKKLTDALQPAYRRIVERSNDGT